MGLGIMEFQMAAWKDFLLHYWFPPIQVWHLWTAQTNQLTHAEIIQYAFFYIWPKDIDKCRWYCFSHVELFWNKFEFVLHVIGMFFSQIEYFGQMAFHTN